MNYFSIDAFIIYGFLLITLVIGLWAGRNVKTIQEYAIANRAYGTGVLTITLLATYITGSQAIGYVGSVYERGILPFIATFFCGVVVCFVFIARYIAPRMYQFEGCLTLAEIMGRLYGPRVRGYIGVLGAFYCLVMVALQIIWIGYIGEIINIPKQLGVLMGGLFLVIYCARGGMRAVAITDILQFIAITAFVALAVSILSHQVSILNVFTHIPTNNFNILQHPSLKYYFVYCLQGLFPSFPLSFPFVQRMLMAKDKRQIADSQYMSMLFLAIFYLLLTFIGLAAIYLKVMGDTSMPQQGSKVFLYIIKTYFPIGVKGVICMGLIATVMSTADSFLHSGGLLIAHDVIQPILERKKRSINVLQASQYATLLLGLIGLYIALSQLDIPRVQYGSMHWGKGINLARDFVAVIFTVPMIAGIMGLKTDARSFFISMAATFVAFFVGKFVLSDLWFMPTVIVVNILSFFGTHYIQNKGFVTVKRAVKVLD